MLLKLLERIQILSVLPSKGDIKTLKVVKDIDTKITITQDEILKYDFKVSEDGKNYLWNELGKTEELEVEFTILELDEIKKALKALETKQELSKSLLDLYIKFVENT
jgi:hypothetical protein